MPKGAEDTEPNHFGTHEFMRLCELLNAEPYLAGNVGSGTPRELYDWVLYCNAPPGSVSQADERAANGHREPFNVKYWGVGNESWGCGGYFKPQEYANEYRRYIAQLPRYSPMSLVAAGPSGGDLNWTRGFFETMPRAVFQTQPGRQPIHGWALHYYTQFRETGNKAVGFTSKQWYEVLDSGRRIESLIESHWKIMGEFDPDHRVKLVIDEWGTWYPAGSEIKPAYILSQMITLRDALHTGINLDIFQRHAGKILMCNVAQTINCLHSLFLADGARYVRTPAYYVFEMYMPHMGGRLIPMQVQAESESVAGSASMQGNQITVTLVNPSLENSLNLTLRLAGAPCAKQRGRY